MRNLALTLLLACASVQADTVATANNRAGGTTVLTDVPCKKEGGFYAYSQVPTGNTQFGCWWSDDAMVHITWSDGDVRSYPFNVFVVNHKNADRLRARERSNVY